MYAAAIMGDFGFYFKEGIDHITDWKGYDHILFVIALCLPYLFNDPIAIGWKQILILITAFTIGHSLTLALSVLNKILISSAWVEFLIPVTILITALENLSKRSTEKRYIKWKYGSALIFGFIHGLGFSNYLRSMLGKDERILTQLLAFNIGLEVGQLFIVAVVVLLSFIVIQVLKTKEREWILFMSGGIFLVSFLMALERLPF